MAQTVIVNPFISLNAMTVSAAFKSVTLAPTVNLVERTSFGDEWIKRIAGTKDWSLSMDFNQDFDAGEIDSIIVGSLCRVGGHDYPAPGGGGKHQQSTIWRRCHPKRLSDPSRQHRRPS